jgi:hypothetical protein
MSLFLFIFTQLQAKEAIYLDASQLINAIHRGNLSVLSNNHIDGTLLNTQYRTQTPLIKAINSLGKQMITIEKRIVQKNNPVSHTTIRAAAFTLLSAAWLMKNSLIDTSSQTSDNPMSSDDLEDDLGQQIVETLTKIMGHSLTFPLAATGIGLFILLPDIYNACRQLITSYIQSKEVTGKEIMSRYQIALRLINHPDIDLDVAQQDGRNALDILQEWQEKVIIKEHQFLLFELEKLILSKTNKGSIPTVALENQ